MNGGLEVKGVTFRYEDMPMRFDLSVAVGEFVAVMGPSGAGKSTLLSLIAGFDPPLSGAIAWEGGDIAALAPAARPLSIMFQDNNLFAHLDAYTNVALGISPSLKLEPAARQSVLAAMARVGLAGFEKRLPGELSGGERQRVALARVLVRRKPLVLLDEPFAALGPAMKQDMIELVRQIQKEHGFTVLLVTHDAEDAKAAATQTAFVHNGRILAKGPTEDIFAMQGLPELEEYLGKRSAPP